MPCYPQCYAYYEIQEFYWSAFSILDLSEIQWHCTWITYQNIYPVPCVLVYEDIFQKLEKTTREILWKQLEKIWKEPYHLKTQKIHNLKLSGNGTVCGFACWLQQEQFWRTSRCAMLSSGPNRKIKIWPISRQNSRFPIVRKWDSAVCSVTDRLKQEKYLWTFVS